MQEVDLEQYLSDDFLLQCLEDENLDGIVDPDDLFRLLASEDEAESHRKGAASSGGAHEGFQGRKTKIQPYRRKRERGDNENTTSPPKRQRILPACAPGTGPGETFHTPVQYPSPCAPPQPSILEIITISRKSLRSVVQTIKLPPHFRLPHAAPAPAFILVPVSPEPKSNTPPQSPVNGAPAPAHPSSSPSGSLSDAAPVSTATQTPEKSVTSESQSPPHLPLPPPPPPPPAMPQTVKTYIQETKDYMGQACEDMGDGLTLSSNYVDFKLIQRDAIRPGKNNNKSLDKELNVMGETERKKCVVQLNQVRDEDIYSIDAWQ
ncbi:uncharacterized protein LOC110155753 [Boleophthalmus pectinirostris]|uniref:uncharacterized protein LOC110155753 n=1 Tax=Boleophthalmus pectinirostris TaxID=150288 RepID=UPI0024322FE9|nr:uncharacterized protein LOC110155753 [Boleophthalmus pectinirostris]